MKTCKAGVWLASAFLSIVLAAPLAAGEVELKFVVHPDDFEAAVGVASQKRGDIETRNIYFVETAKRELGGVQLILRLREKPGKKDDATVKLRGPTAASVDLQKFAAAGAGEESKLEIDRVVGGRDALSFSITAKQKEGDVAKLRVGERKLAELFSTTQKSFLAHYAGGVAWQSALLLGPVKTEKWEFEIRDFPGKLTAEIWHLPGEKSEPMIEFSIKADSGHADALAESLKSSLTALKLRQPEKPESKTQAVLDRLLGQPK
ncbi:MAG: hypothetical protein ABMA13_16920 [Chthoniobacteraceae bacterium]